MVLDTLEVVLLEPGALARKSPGFLTAMRRFKLDIIIWALPPVILFALVAVLLSIPFWPLIGLIAVALFAIMTFVQFEFCLLIMIALIPFDPQREVLPNLPIYLDLARLLLLPAFVYRVLRAGLPQVPRWSYFLWAYFLVCFLSGYVQMISPITFGKDIVRLFVDLSFTWMVASTFNSTEKIMRAVRVFLVASVPLSIYGIFQVVVDDYGGVWYWMNTRLMEIAPPWTGRASSFLAHANHLGLFVNALIPFGFACVVFSPHSRWRRFSILATGLLIGCLFLTFSRGAWIAFGTIAGLWVVSQRRLGHAFTVLLIGSLISIFLVFNLAQVQGQTQTRGEEIDEATLQGRILLLRIAATMFVKHPVLGVGYSNFAQTLENYVNWESDPVPCHNLYFQLLSETGILGFGFFLLPTLLLLRGCLRRYRLTENENPKLKIVLIGCCGAILAVLVHGMFDVPVQVYTSPPFNELYWLIIGLALVLSGKQAASAFKQPNPVPPARQMV